MKKPIYLQYSLQIITIAGLLSGCASAPEPLPEPAPTSAPIISGEQMLQDSKGMANLGERWKKGKSLVDSGNKMVHDGQSKIDEGNRMISEGQKIIQESEETYKTIKK